MSRIAGSLPDSITIPTGEVLTPYVGGDNQREIISTCKARGAKYRLIQVLHGNLKGKTDLHGHPYKPTQWVFTNLDSITKP